MWVAAPPSTSTMPTCRWSRPSSSSSRRCRATSGGGAVVEVGEGQALVGDVGVGLGGDGADPGDRRRDGRADGQELGGDGDAPRLVRRRSGPRSRRSCADPSRGRSVRSQPISACLQPARGSRMDGCCTRLGFPSIGGHRRFVTAIGVDAVGSAGCSCRSRCSTSSPSPP